MSDDGIEKHWKIFWTNVLFPIDIMNVQRISLCQKVVHVNPDKHSAEIEPVWECRVLVKNSDLPDSSYLQKIYFHAETLKVM